jgi:hypothetical protein
VAGRPPIDGVASGRTTLRTPRGGPPRRSGGCVTPPEHLGVAATTPKVLRRWSGHPLVFKVFYLFIFFKKKEIIWGFLVILI